MSDSIPRILITVEGGTVQEVLSDCPVEYLLVDWDNREHDESYVPEIAGAEVRPIAIDEAFARAPGDGPYFPPPESGKC